MPYPAILQLIREALAFGEIVGDRPRPQGRAPTDATVLVLGESGTGKRAVILAEGGRIRLDLPLPQNRGPSAATEPWAPALYGRGGAAELLSIKATALASRMKALGIKRPRA